MVTSQHDFEKLSNSGLNLDGGIYKKGLYFETVLSEDEMRMLQNSGVSYQVTIDDWMAYYNNIPNLTPQQIQEQMKMSVNAYTITHSIYGTMGGHLTYSQVANKLDSMRLQYPTLISVKFSIGNSFENRSMWTVRVTKNPDAPTGRPEIWYNGVTHAREPMGMMNVFYYLYWLFENYNIDPIATYILNTREIYFTPILNPDGYVYNETTNPNGGGMWRKNRQPYGGSTGTDLNRNFGTYNFWNSTNNGSSTSPSSDTYRGPYPFSAKEDSLFRIFENSRNFKCQLDYHTYGNLLIKPWAWCDPTPTPDDAIFNEFGADATSENHYAFGTPYQTVGYYVRGGDLDWIYSSDSTGHTTHRFGMTPEVGAIGFYSNPANIIPEAQNCVWQNIYMSLVAGPYVSVKSYTLNKSYYTQNETGNIKVIFRNKGLSNATNVTLSFTQIGSYLTIPITTITRPTVNSRTSDSATFNFTVAAGAPNNFAIPTILKIKQDTNTVYTKTVYVMVGAGNIAFADSAENGFSKWTTTNTWAITNAQYHSPSNSFTDSPGGNYVANTNNSMTNATPVNVSAYPAVFLSFWHKYTTEAGYDFCYVEVSSNNGTTWQNVATYNGTLSTWTQVSLDITSQAAATANLRFRFRLTSDGSLQYDGWYVDDIKLTTYATITGVENNNTGIPNKYALNQNYPNPFNPVTLISYSIPKQSFVKITVYDLLGREIQKLVNEVKIAGTYNVAFDGENLSTGVYYYKLESDGFVDVKKMMLIK
jgi:hypothetical protein